MMVAMTVLVTTGTAEPAIGLPLHGGWLTRMARAGAVTPAETTATGDHLWDLEDLARQLDEQVRDRQAMAAAMTGGRAGDGDGQAIR